MRFRTKLLALCLLSGLAFGEIQVATFDVNATPSIGSRLAYEDMVAAEQHLKARGIVLTGIGEPIVLCAVDWLGIANEGQDRWKRTLAAAANTTVDRVAVHALHQHSAPRCDFTTADILAAAGHTNILFNAEHAMAVMAQASNAVVHAMANRSPVSHVGVGTARVDRVASNRRILGDNGKVRAMRWTACRSPALRAEPVGVVDDRTVVVGLFKDETPLVVLSWFACHPQSYYRNGVANPDFPGSARILREARFDDVMHLHFTGAGGNIGAGKWNDGQRHNRLVLAQRLADGIGDAWSNLTRHQLDAGHVDWRTKTLELPLGNHLVESNLVAQLETAKTPYDRLVAAKHLAWLRRANAGSRVTLGCLDFGPVAGLFMPGELFVEYQLAAQKMAPDKVVAVAAYGEYGVGYIPTKAAFAEGGYEAEDRATRVGPAVEGVLMDAMKELLPDNKVGEGRFPRVPATEPAAALATFEVAPGMTLELVAHEPDVVDPIAMAFDERGRAFVVEMRGYSERREDALGRVRLLEDTDADGRFDRSRVFADGLKWPTAVICYDGGVFVAATPDVWFFKDSDGDGKADIKRRVLTGFAAGKKRLNMQALVNSFRWGPDNRIWGATASSGGLVRRPDQPESEAVQLRGADFSFDPEKLDLRREHGTAQFGMTFDWEGRRFVCSNSRHVQWVAYEAQDLAARGGPNWASWPAPIRDIAADSAAAPVFRSSPDEPWRIVRTRWRVAGVVRGIVEGGGRVSGYFTSASGIHAHRGHLFIGDVGSNLVHAKQLEFVKGVPTARPLRHAPETEFLRSRDNWFRPVSFATGPDGGLYITDMYRETIEHPWSLPPGIKEHLDLNSGFDRGRIYRVADASAPKTPAKDLGTASAAELRALTNSANGWERDTSRRLLYQRGTPVKQERELVLDHPDDNEWSRVTRLRTLETPAAVGAAFRARLEGGPGIGTLPDLVWLAGRSGDAGLIGEVADTLAAADRVDVLPDFKRGVRDWSAVTRRASWVEWRAAKVENLASAAAVRTAGLLGAGDETFRHLLTPELDADLARAMVDNMSDLNWFAGNVNALPDAVRGSVLDRVVEDAEAARRLLSGDVDVSMLSAQQRSVLRGHRDVRVRAHVIRVLPPLRSRAQVIAEYRESLEVKGDPVAGKAVFTQACAACHRSKTGEGIALGPDAASFANAGGEVLLGHILDPNREVQPQYQAYLIELANGDQLAGILTRETTREVTMKLLGGIERVFDRKDVVSMKGMGRSLMPEGLESGISVRQMADLLSYLVK